MHSYAISPLDYWLLMTPIYLISYCSLHCIKISSQTSQHMHVYATIHVIYINKFVTKTSQYTHISGVYAHVIIMFLCQFIFLVSNTTKYFGAFLS